MTRTRETDRSPIHALLSASEPIGATRTVRVALRAGEETLWSLVETASAGNPLEPVLLGLWKLLGEASRRRMGRLTVYLDEPDAVDLLERRAPVPSELGKLFLITRSRMNQFVRIRFRPLRELPRPTRPAPPARREAQLSLFGDRVA